MSKVSGKFGGPVAIRGYLVQTLVALLDIAHADPPFTEITLEPAVGDEQFDFLWKDSNGSYATQVKSTINSFDRSDVTKWAKKLEAARTNEQCRLILVGNVPPNLKNLNSVGSVAIEKKNLNLTDLLEQAAHRLAVFLEHEKENPGTSSEREMVVHALVSKLEYFSTTSEPLNRNALVRLLSQWIRSAPRQKLIVDISHFNVIKCAPAELAGRADQLKFLNNVWAKAQNNESQRPHVLTFVALGGEGKTSLVARWAADLAHQNWPGCEAVFAWSFYSQGTREQTVASSDVFIKEALTFFGDAATAGSSASAFDKGRRLAHLVGERRALLILDGLEPLQYAPSSPRPGELKDHGLAALIKGLAADSYGLCVVTTRYSIPDLRAFWQTNAPEIKLMRLSRTAGAQLLRKLGVRGTQKKFYKLVENVKGHALTLSLLGRYIQRAHQGDIRRVDRVDFQRVNEKEQGGHAFRVIAAYERWFTDNNSRVELAILRMLGLFDRPANVGCLAILRQRPVIPGLNEPLLEIEQEDWNLALANLEACGLASKVGAGFSESGVDSHALIRHYFGHQLRKNSPNAWCAAHERLFGYLKTLAPYQPDDIVTMEVLYQSVTHGCLAGKYSGALHKVYLPRIQRGQQFFSTYVLAAFDLEIAALESFFGPGWKVFESLSNEDQSVVLTRTGYALRSAGRLSEAALVLEKAVAVQRRINHFKDASISSGILGHVWLNIGRLDRALSAAREGVGHARRSGDCLQQITKQSILSQILHYMGQDQRALRAFKRGTLKEKEMPEVQEDHEFPVLNCLSVYNYSELLLSANMVAELSHRVNDALRLLNRSRDRGHALAIALMTLAQGRVGLFQGDLDEAESLLNIAVDQFKAAGREDDQARVLLARADLWKAKRTFDRCERDVRSALDAANRCEAGTCQADCHLSMACLRLQQENTNAARFHLRRAVSICKHETVGYHRRDGEIVRLKAALRDRA
jgi:tetratricopeptide (TPR) repeat protein